MFIALAPVVKVYHDSSELNSVKVWFIIKFQRKVNAINLVGNSKVHLKLLILSKLFFLGLMRIMLSTLKMLKRKIPLIFVLQLS